LIGIGGGKCLARSDWLLALRNDGSDVAQHMRDPQTAHMLREVAPVRSDVAERRRGAALVWLQPPRVVGVLEEPVLKILADEKVGFADVAARNHVPRLLDERVASIVERHRMNDAGFCR